MKSSQIEHNLQIYHRYQQIPFVKGAPFSKPPFWVSMLVFGSVSFPLGNGRTSPKLKQKKSIHPTRAIAIGLINCDNPKIYNELPHRPFVWRSLLSRLWAWPPPRFGFQLPTSSQLRMGSMGGGNMQLMSQAT